MSSARAESTLIERWKCIEEPENAHDPESDRKYKALKEKWFEDAFVFINGLPPSSHCWCQHKEVTLPLLEPFYLYLKSSETSAIHVLWRRMSSEFRRCINCVVEYHKAKDIYRAEYVEHVVEPIMAVLESLDRNRVASHLEELLKSKSEDSPEVICVLFEVLMFPTLLDSKRVDEAFVPFLKFLAATHDLHLSKNQRYPGLYALLFHSNEDIRRIAAGLAYSIGPFNDAEELEAIQPVLEKRMRYLESALPSKNDIGDLDVGITYESLWLGTKTLLGLLKASAFEEGIIERYPAFISVVLNHVSETTNVFWNALLCLKLLIEVLGYKLWLKSSFTPGVLRNTLLSQCFHGRQERIHKAIFDLFPPFLQSLEAVQDGQYERQRRNLIYFFLLQVPNSSNFTSLMRKSASQVAFSVVSRSYKMQPPSVPFECAHFWGPPLISTFADTQLHLSVRKPAIELIQIILVTDAAALAGIYSKEEAILVPYSVPEDGSTLFSWQKVEAQLDRWFCIPLIWIEVLERLKDTIISPVLAKAFIWAVSRLSIFDLKSCTSEGELLMVEGDHAYSSKVGSALHWEKPSGCDDGSDGKACSNAVKADENLSELTWIFKRAANSFAGRLFDELATSLTWDPALAEALLLLSLDASPNLRKLGKHLRDALAPTSLEAAVQAIFQNGESVLSFGKGFSFATKMLMVQPFNHCFPLQQLFFISSKVFSLRSQSAPWKAFCQDLSQTLWPLLVKVMAEGKHRAAMLQFELCCTRMLELLPVVFKCMIPAKGSDSEQFGLFWEVRIGDDCPSWFENLVSWREISSPTIRRHWNEAMVSVLEDLARGPLSFTARRSKAVSIVLQPGSGLNDDQRERMEVLFSTGAVIEDRRETIYVSDDDALNAKQVPSDEPKEKVVLQARRHKGPVSVRKAARPAKPVVTTAHAEGSRANNQTHKEKLVSHDRAQADIIADDQVDPGKTDTPENEQILKEIVSEDGPETTDAALEAAKRQRTSIAPTALHPRRKLVRIEMPREHVKGGASARVKARPQRPPPPRLDEWLQRILSLDLFSLEAAESLVKVPTTFRDVEHYLEVFRPLLLEEFKAQLQREVETKDSFTANLMSLDRVDQLHNGRFTSGRGTGGAPMACMENDLILLSKQPFEKAQEDVHVLGKVDRREMNKTEGIILLVKLYILSPNNERLRKARVALVERSSWNVTRVTNITAQLREFQAISSLGTSPLSATVLHPAAAKRTFRPATLESKGLPRGFCARLKQEYNSSQISAIEASLETQVGSHHHITLVQGPPGTGKTRTIVAIISALLQSGIEELASGDTGNSGRVNYHSAVARAWQDAAVAKQMGAERDSSRSSKRVLVCAQSNAAVDELVSRICENGLYDSSGKFYKPKVVRVGNANSVHPDSIPYFIDTLVEKRLGDKAEADPRDETPSFRATLEEITETISKLEIQCSELGDDKQEEAGTLRLKLSMLRNKRREITSALQKAESQARKNTETNKANQKKVRNDIIREAEVVLTTLSGSGGDTYAACMESIGQKKEVFFDAIVIDEAGQALEPATLIPLQLLSYSYGRCIMIGDPKQLPATVMSQAASSMCFQRSMFERFQDSGFPVTMLSVQYRMHPEICKFPSQYFYDNQLVDAGDVSGDRRVAPFHKEKIFGPYTFLDVVEGQEASGGTLQSVSNVAEANVAVELFKSFIARYGKEFRPGRFGVITPYKRQQNLLREKFSKAFPDHYASIEFNTVDGFQGREVDVLVLSTVRSESRIGFVADVRRMNVALTRARFSLWVLGNAKALRNDPSWAALLKDASERQVIIPVRVPYSKTFNLDAPANRNTNFLENSTSSQKRDAVEKQAARGTPDPEHSRRILQNDREASKKRSVQLIDIPLGNKRQRTDNSSSQRNGERNPADTRWKPDNANTRRSPERGEHKHQSYREHASTSTGNIESRNNSTQDAVYNRNRSNNQDISNKNSQIRKPVRDLNAERKNNRAEAMSFLGNSLIESKPAKRPR